MRVRLTELTVGGVYDLPDTVARYLIGKGLAKAVDNKPKAITNPVKKAQTRPV